MQRGVPVANNPRRCDVRGACAGTRSRRRLGRRPPARTGASGPARRAAARPRRAGPGPTCRRPKGARTAGKGGAPFCVPGTPRRPSRACFVPVPGYPFSLTRFWASEPAACSHSCLHMHVHAIHTFAWNIITVRVTVNMIRRHAHTSNTHNKMIAVRTFSNRVNQIINSPYDVYTLYYIPSWSLLLRLSTRNWRYTPQS